MTRIKSVNATTTAQDLGTLVGALIGGAQQIAREVTIQVSPGASGTLYVGDSAVTAGNALELAAGQSWTIRGAGNQVALNNIYLLASAGTIRANVAMEVA